MLETKDMIAEGIGSNSVPSGTNKLKSRSLFAERKYYKHYILPRHENSNVEDFWYDLLFYGKVNKHSYAIEVRKANLKQINAPGANDSYFAIDFVADAFKDLQEYIKKAFVVGKGLEKKNTVFNVLAVADAYRDPSALYDDLLNRYIGAFNVGLFGSSKDRQIKSLGDYVVAFKNYLNMMVEENVPVTKTHFIVSNQNSINCSGLVVELQKKLYSDDFAKFVDVVADANFKFFMDAAKRHGFFVDKNVPWRLIFDIASPASDTYMSRNYSSNKALFEISFDKVYYSDIEQLQSLFYKAYSKFAFQARKPCVQDMSKSEFLSKFGKDDWLQYYLELRYKEMRKDRTSKEIQKTIRNARTIERQYGMIKMMDYINKNIGPYEVASAFSSR